MYDPDFATKAIGMAATTSFSTVKVHGVKIRNLFISQFQKDFEGKLQKNSYLGIRLLLIINIYIYKLKYLLYNNFDNTMLIMCRQ